jgi:hypothetical protein
MFRPGAQGTLHERRAGPEDAGKALLALADDYDTRHSEASR